MHLWTTAGTAAWVARSMGRGEAAKGDVLSEFVRKACQTSEGWQEHSGRMTKFDQGMLANL